MISGAHACTCALKTCRETKRGVDRKNKGRYIEREIKKKREDKVKES